MSRQDNAAPVVIKRKRVVHGGGHHGGAWKVAYADFVTAMMAFFLLMWLLNVATEAQRSGLADYFSPTVPVSRTSGGGDGVLGGDSAFADDNLAHTGTGGRSPSSGRVAVPEEASAPDTGAATLEELAVLLMERGGESRIMEQALRHVITRVTDAGLIVELFDLPDRPLFAKDGETPEAVLEVLIDMIADVFARNRNGVAVEGHIRAYPTVLRDNPVWDRSTARAQTVREMLQDSGMTPSRLHRVTGHGDRQPVRRDAMAVRNNRMEVILLRDD